MLSPTCAGAASTWGVGELETVMKRNLALIAASTLMAGLLTGCGGDSGTSASDTYCDSMESAKQTFADFDEGDVAGLEEAINKFHELAAAAPDDIAEAWATLDGTLVALEDALAEAGLEMADLEAISNGEMPADIDLAKLTALSEDLEKLGAAEVEEAAAAIEKHAKDECDIDLSES